MVVATNALEGAARSGDFDGARRALDELAPLLEQVLDALADFEHTAAGS